MTITCIHNWREDTVRPQSCRCRRRRHCCTWVVEPLFHRHSLVATACRLCEMDRQQSALYSGFHSDRTDTSRRWNPVTNSNTHATFYTDYWIKSWHLDFKILIHTDMQCLMTERSSWTSSTTRQFSQQLYCFTASQSNTEIELLEKYELQIVKHVSLHVYNQSKLEMQLLSHISND